MVNLQSSNLRFQLLRLLVIFFGLSLFVSFTQSGQSYIPTNWGVAIDWGRYYIVQFGEIYSHTDSSNYVANIRDYGSEEIFPKILFAVINIVTGTRVFPEGVSFLQFLPWVGLIAIPAFSLSWYRFIGSSQGTYHWLDSLLVQLYAVFPLASVMVLSTGDSNGSIPARLLFIMMIYLVGRVFIGCGNKRITTLIIGVLPLYYYFYHSWSYYFFIYISTLGLYVFLFDSERKNISRVAIICIITFIGYVLYINRVFLTEFRAGALSLSETLNSLIVGSSSAPPIDTQYLTRGSGSSVYDIVSTLDIILLSVLCLTVASVFFWNLVHSQEDEVGKFLMILSAGQALVGVALFTKGGISSVMSRLFPALIALSMLYSGYLLTQKDKYLRIISRAVLLTCVVVSLIGFVYYPTTVEITHEEAAGIETTAEIVPEGKYIMSDFGLATPFLYHGHSSVRIFHSQRISANKLEKIVNSIYYDVQDPETVLDPHVGTNDYYVITSAHQRVNGPSGPTYVPYKPASTDFQSKWRNASGYHTVYDNGDLLLHKRNEE